MAIEIQAPQNYDQYLSDDYYIIFMAGSIEKNCAKQWQRRLISLFKNYTNVVLLNPRRDAWNSSLENNEQVVWELAGMEHANAIVMYFDPNTLSPVSLLELGLFASDLDSNGKHLMHVICPKGFWRKGNVDIVCKHYGLPQFNSLKAATDQIKGYIGKPPIDG